MTFDLRYCQTSGGGQPFAEWLQGLRDRQARARVEARLARVAVGKVIVLLHFGGDKRTQQKDIKRAKAYFEDYKARTARKARGA